MCAYLSPSADCSSPCKGEVRWGSTASRIKKGSPRLTHTPTTRNMPPSPQITDARAILRRVYGFSAAMIAQ